MIFPYIGLNWSYVEYFEIVKIDEILSSGDIFIMSVTGSRTCYSYNQEHFEFVSTMYLIYRRS